MEEMIFSRKQCIFGRSNVKVEGRSPLIFALMRDEYQFLRFLFKLPTVNYDTADLNGMGLYVKSSTVRKCIDIVREEQKKNGYNYSDLVNFFQIGLKIKTEV